MSIFFDKIDPLDFPAQNGVMKAEPGFAENFYAAARKAYATDMSVSEGAMLKEQWQPIVDEVNERTGSNSSIPQTN